MKTKLSLILGFAVAASLGAAAAAVRIVQTNAAGDSVMLIDPATNKVVGQIEGIEGNHGATVAPDGSRFYITNEAEWWCVCARATNGSGGGGGGSGRPAAGGPAPDGSRFYITNEAESAVEVA